MAKQRLVVAAVAVVGYLVVLFVWGSSAPPSSSQVGPQYVKGEVPGSFTPLIAIAGGLMVVGVVMLGFTFVTLLRPGGPRFHDLSASEQGRRREAARLLKGDADSS
ncbi:MAG: hypothetical protein ACXWB2_12495 [Acidimicrobiales bacterium]